MKKQLFVILISAIAVLTACSDEIKVENSSGIDQADEVKKGEVDTDDRSEDKEKVVNENDNTSKELESLNEATVTEKSATMELEKDDDVSVVHEKIKNENFWNYYKDLNDDADSKKDVILPVSEQLSEDAIELPLLENNKDYFLTENVEEVLLEDLEKEGIIEFYQEPTSMGYLIDIDLNLLMDLYPAQTYSLNYEDIEYGVMISAKDPMRGLIFVEVPEIDLTELKTHYLSIIK